MPQFEIVFHHTFYRIHSILTLSIDKLSNYYYHDANDDDDVDYDVVAVVVVDYDAKKYCCCDYYDMDENMLMLMFHLAKLYTNMIIIQMLSNVRMLRESNFQRNNFI